MGNPANNATVAESIEETAGGRGRRMPECHIDVSLSALHGVNGAPPNTDDDSSLRRQLMPVRPAQDVVDRLDQLLWIDRLRQVLLVSERKRFVAIRHGGVGRDG